MKSFCHGNEKVFMYLFNRCHENQTPVSNLQYQKLLYYLHGWAMALEKINHFEKDAFRAWRYGPVHLKEYECYKKYKNEKIDICFPQFKEKDFLVSLVADIYGRLSPNQLVSMAHEEIPWLQNKKKGQESIIPDDEIHEYFSSEAILKNPVHCEFLEDYFHQKDSVSFEEIADFSEEGAYPSQKWDAVKAELRLP